MDNHNFIDIDGDNDAAEEYKKIIEEDFKDISDRNKFLTYMKIGDESSYKQVESKGYKVVKRKDILAILEKYNKQSGRHNRLSKIGRRICSNGCERG